MGYSRVGVIFGSHKPRIARVIYVKMHICLIELLRISTVKSMEWSWNTLKDVHDLAFSRLYVYFQVFYV